MATENENFIIPTQHIDTFNINDAGTFSGSKKITLNTKDTYVPENIEVTVDATVNVQEGTLNKTASPNVTYVNNTDPSTVIPANGALYINEGWFPNTMIELGHLIPDDADYDNAGSSHIRTGFEAYDTNGNKLIGTIDDVTPTFKGGVLTATPSVVDLTVPKITCSATGKLLPTGTGNLGTNYGVTTTAISGTEGTDFLSIDATHSKTDGSVKARAEASGTTVKYNGATTGYINVADNTEVKVLTSVNATTQTATTITTDVTDSFEKLYIPIVKVEGDGGTVTRTGGSGSISGTNPNVTISYSGKFTEVGSGGTGANYGVTTTAPSGTDGTNFLKIQTDTTSDTAQSWSGTATINYSRSAITVKSNVKGLTNMSTSEVLKASATGSLEQTISGSVQATASGQRTYYIPIVNVTHSGGEVTATASGSTGTQAKATVTNNILGKTSTGDTINVGNYGFSAGNWSLSEMSQADAGKGYITIYPSYSSNNPTCVCKANAHVNAVTYSNNAGAVAAHSEETALAEHDATTSTKTVTLSSTQVVYTSGKRSWRIPIVEPKGTGGIVTVAATASISPVGEEGGSTAPEVSIDYSGWLNDHDDTYGIVYEEPTGFYDGDSYVLLSVSNTNTDGSIVGSISGHYDRTAVKADDIYQGVVNMSTSTELLAAASNQPISGTFTTGSIGANVTGQKDIYIPVAQYSITGGDLTQDSFTVSTATDNKDMTPDMSFSKGTGNGTGSSITSSTYGIGITKPSSGDWVSIDPSVSDGSTTSGTHSITFSGSASVTRAAVTASMTRGITTDTSWMLNSTTSNLSGSGTWSYTLKSGTTRYITVSTATPSVVEHTIVDPTATGSENASFKIQGTPQTLPAGVNILTSEPVDFDTYSGGYIIIEPNVTTTAGSSSAKSKVSITKGITSAKDVVSAIDAQNVSVTVNTASDKCYIKVYKVEPNGYTIS